MTGTIIEQCPPTGLWPLGFVTTAVAGMTAPVVTAVMDRSQWREEEVWLVVEAAVLAVGDAVDAVEDCFGAWSRDVRADSDEGQAKLQAVHASAEPIRYGYARAPMRLGGDDSVAEHMSGIRTYSSEAWETVLSEYEQGHSCHAISLERCRDRLTQQRQELTALVYLHLARRRPSGWPSTDGLFVRS